MKNLKSLVVLGILIVAAVPMFAASQNATVTVNANVVKQCAIQGATLNFGAYDPFTGAAVAGSTTMNVRCTKNAASVTISLSTDRVMSNGADNLNYTLTQGDGSDWDTTTTVGYTAADSNWFALTILGQITSGQDVSDGSYTDTVTATINY